MLLASDTGEIRIFDATGGKLLQSSSLPARPSVPTVPAPELAAPAAPLAHPRWHWRRRVQACFCTRSEEASSLALALPGFGAVALILSTAAQQADALRAAEVGKAAARAYLSRSATGYLSP